MDSEKIGLFLSKLRKEKNFTQKELANKINVSEKAISKWETGRGIPDISNIESICKVFEISITEFLNAEKEKDEKIYIDYINYTKKESKKKYTIIILITILVFIVLLLLSYFINNFNKIKIYKLNAESENFTYENGLLIISNQKIILKDGIITAKNNLIDSQDIVEFSLLLNNKQIYKTNIMNNIYEEKIGYNEIFTKDIINNKDKWIIEITYRNNNNIIKKETMNISFKELFKNDKLVKSDIQSISQSNEKIDINKISQEIKEKLENNDFKEVNYPGIYEKQIGDGYYTVRGDGSNIYYYNKKDNYSDSTSYNSPYHTFIFYNTKTTILYNAETKEYNYNDQIEINKYKTIIENYINEFEKIF